MRRPSKVSNYSVRKGPENYQNAETRQNFKRNFHGTPDAMHKWGNEKREACVNEEPAVEQCAP